MEWIRQFSGHDVVLDTNVLLLWVTGSIDPGLVPRWPFTASRFAEEDFFLLQHVLRQMRSLVSTPGIIGEASHFLEDLSGEYKTAAFDALAKQVESIDERYWPSKLTLQHKAASVLGVFDTSQLVLLDKDSRICLLSDDGPLVDWAQRSHLKAINFNHLRFLGL